MAIAVMRVLNQRRFEQVEKQYGQRVFCSRLERSMIAQAKIPLEPQNLYVRLGLRHAKATNAPL
jgi:hypothetical protein